jgi:oligopeptide transport system ATP-binding protein
VSFNILEGETLGLVGESGCGKSTTARLLLGLLRPDSGSILFNDVDLATLDRQGWKPIRRKLQMIFQDPSASLDPRMTVGATLSEVMQIHGLGGGRQGREARVVELLELVGLNAEHRNRYPHQFSGGQRQRIGIARALAVEPRLIVCDEPVSALDVSVQAQIVNLLEDLRARLGLSYLFVAHDLSVVEHLSDRVAVMYLGRIVEIGTTRAVYGSPAHPYTEALLDAAPIADPGRKRARSLLQGDVPSPVEPPSGCRFHTRCPMRQPECSVKEQVLQQIAPDQWVACHVRAASRHAANNQNFFDSSPTEFAHPHPM